MNKDYSLQHIIQAIENRIPLRFINDPIIKELDNQKRAYLKVSSYCKKHKQELNLVNNNQEEAGSKDIWVFWYQGWDNIPDLIKVTRQSIINNCSGWNIHFLDKDNYKDYIEFPDIITARFNAGCISMAHLSDILRLELLSKWGGLWIDSTVYCSSCLTLNEISNQDLFFYSDVKTPWCSMSSWLIYAKKNNPIINETLRLLIEYWKQHKTLYHYYQFHMVVSYLLNTNKEYKTNILLYPNITPHLLDRIANDDFNNEMLNVVLSQSSFHKLSLKNDYDIKNNTNIKHVLINQNI